MKTAIAAGLLLILVTLNDGLSFPVAPSRRTIAPSWRTVPPSSARHPTNSNTKQTATHRLSRPSPRLSVASVPADTSDDDNSPSSSRRKKISATTFNLVKAIAGSGILALPAGVAAMSDVRKSLIPAVALMVALGGLSAYSFSLYGRLLHQHDAGSLGELWEKEKGKSSSWVISLGTLTFCFGAAISYSILLGDTFPALAATAGLDGIFLSRHFWILLMTSTVLYPLANLESLLGLAGFSMVGVAAVAATTCFLGWRCPTINPASPYMPLTGALIPTLSAKLLPSFNTFNKGILSSSATTLIGMAASAYMGHFSAPSFYRSLRGETGGDKSKDLKSFNIVTTLGFSVATLLNCLVMCFGFLTFGGASDGVILNNFSTHDAGASICRLLMAICVTGGFPFLMRSVVTEFLGLFGKSSRKDEKKATILGVLGVTAAALVMKDAGSVISFSGAVMGSFIVYIFPATMYLSNSSRISEKNWRQKTDRFLCRGLIGFGAFVAGLSVASSCFPRLFL